MHTTRSISHPGRVSSRHPPGSRHLPLEQALLRTRPSQTRHPLDQAPLRDQAPPGETPPWHPQPPRADTPWPPSPWWTEFLTHACENITLPQTSFAGGNKPSRNNLSLCATKVTVELFVDFDLYMCDVQCVGIVIFVLASNRWSVEQNRWYRSHCLQ